MQVSCNPTILLILQGLFTHSLLNAQFVLNLLYRQICNIRTYYHLTEVRPASTESPDRCSRKVNVTTCLRPVELHWACSLTMVNKSSSISIVVTLFSAFGHVNDALYSAYIDGTGYRNTRSPSQEHYITFAINTKIKSL